MGRQAVVVSDGMKSGRGASRSDVARAQREVGAGIYARISALLRGKEPEKQGPAKPHEVVFQSRYRRHRIQIDSPADIIDARGRKTQGRTLFAQFQDHLFSIPKHLKDDQKQFMLDVLKQHPRFGVDKDFWEQADLDHKARVAQVARVVDLLEKNEDVKNTVLDYLTERDFVDPLLKGEGPTAQEIADADMAEDVEDEKPKRRTAAPAKPPTRKRRAAANP